MRFSPSAVTEPAAAPGRPAPGTLPRLLAGLPPRGAASLEEHEDTHGQLPSLRGHGRRGGHDLGAALIDEIERSGLRGRGGAAFPTATKLRAVARSRGRAIVVVNGAEGEPASLKDRTLMELAPQLVLDGALLTAQALGGDEVIVCIGGSARASLDAVALAIEERHDIAAPGRSPRLRVSAVPDHYVAGEETALVNLLGGGPGKPTFTPPLPSERGIRRRPTLVNNVETLAHIALIARHGARWFRELGTAGQPGSTLVTLSGPVANPGVYEIEQGSSLSSLIAAGGGLTAGARGALLGGYAGTWVARQHLQGVALSNEHLAAHGSSLGAGVVLLLSEDACPVGETARTARWLAGQSTRQCGPCIHGLDALASSLQEIVDGMADGRATQRIERLAGLVSRRGACSHPDGALNFILSSLECFAAEFADHARHGRCERCARPAELPLPARAPASASRTTLPSSR